MRPPLDNSAWNANIRLPRIVTLLQRSYARIHGRPDVTPGVLTAPLWVLFIMNNKKGVMSNVLIRRAAQAAINCTDALTAAFGEKSLWRPEGSIYPDGTAWFDEIGRAHV